MAQFLLKPIVEVQHRGNHCRRHGKGYKSYERTISAPQQTTLQQVSKHRGAHAHASPLSTTTGSRRNARRIAAALPPIVTSSARSITTGSNTGVISTREWKMALPIRCAIKLPNANPNKPPPRARREAYVTNTEAIVEA